MAPHQTHLTPSDLAEVVAFVDCFDTLLNFTLVSKKCTQTLSLVERRPLFSSLFCIPTQLAVVLKSEAFFPNLKTYICDNWYCLDVPFVPETVERIELLEALPYGKIQLSRDRGALLSRISRCTVEVDTVTETVDLTPLSAVERCTLLLQAPIGSVELPPHQLDFLRIVVLEDTPFDFIASIPRHAVRHLYVQVDVRSSEDLDTLPSFPGVTFILNSFVVAALDRFMAVPSETNFEYYHLIVESESDCLDGFVERYAPARLDLILKDVTQHVDLSRYTSIQRVQCRPENVTLPHTPVHLRTNSEDSAAVERGLDPFCPALVSTLTCLTRLVIDHQTVNAPLSLDLPALASLCFEGCKLSAPLDAFTTLTQLYINKCEFNPQTDFPTSLCDLEVDDSSNASFANIPSITRLTELNLRRLTGPFFSEHRRTSLDLSPLTQLREVSLDISAHVTFPTSVRYIEITPHTDLDLSAIPEVECLRVLRCGRFVFTPPAVIHQLDLYDYHNNFGSLRDVRIDYLDCDGPWVVMELFPVTLKGFVQETDEGDIQEDCQLFLERQPNLRPLIKKHYLTFGLNES